MGLPMQAVSCIIVWVGLISSIVCILVLSRVWGGSGNFFFCKNN